MTLSTVATRYANALADVVAAPGSALRPLDAALELRAIADTIQGSVELRHTLATPAVPVNRKRAVVGRIAGILKLSPMMRNFLFVLVDHGRMGALPEIAQRFEEIADERLGFARADVATPREFEDAGRAALNGALDRLTGKRVRMRFAIDESLIGGAIARIGSTVYDGSVRGQLKSLERRLGAES
jgi:F-type H+-transporting ATPase subunit delta